MMTERSIVTAAHCIQNKRENVSKKPNELFFMVGKNNLKNDDEEGSQMLSFSEVKVHPDWEPFLLSYDADIAVGVLKTSILFHQNVKPICLPTEHDSIQFGVKGLVAGWGRMENRELSSKLKLAQISVVERSVCVNNDNLYSHVMTSRTFCSELANRGPCQGDSGGGYAQKIKNQWKLFGIVSFTITESCAEKRHIGYTDVSKYLRWIRQYTEITYTTPTVSPTTTIISFPTTANSAIITIPTTSENFCGRKDDLNLENWPWAVKVQRTDVYCSGTLISNSAVITRGGCFRTNIQDFKTILGDQDQTSKSSYKRNVFQFVNHPLVNTYYLENNSTINSSDIAIIHLDQPVEFSKKAQPICMFDQSSRNVRVTAAMVLKDYWNYAENHVAFKGVDISKQFLSPEAEYVDIYLEAGSEYEVPEFLYVNSDDKWFFWGIYKSSIRNFTVRRYQNLNKFKNWIHEELTKNRQ